MADEDEGEGWRFDLEEVGEDDADSTGSDQADADREAADARTNDPGADDAVKDTDGAGDDAGSVAGAVRGAGASRSIEPGSPRIENVLFVVLGALVAIALVADFLSIAGF